MIKYNPMKAHLSFVTLLALFILAACSSQTSDSEADVATPVSVEDLKPGSIEQVVNTTGTVVATKEVTLSTEIDGNYILQINPKTGNLFILGDMVDKDQVIVELEDKEYLSDISLEEKKLNLQIAKQEYTQQKSLFDKGGVTQSELSDAELALVSAQNSYELARIQLEEMKVSTPFKGIITELPYYTQETKVSSGTEVVTLMSYEKLLLEIDLPEKYINTIKRGMDIRVMNYTLPEDTLNGKVSQVSPAISSTTRTFTAKLLIDNDHLKLRPGMFVQTDIILDRKDSVIVIPKDVIISNQRGKSVFVVQKGTAEEKQVTLGYTSQDKVEITSGLKANDRLVIKGYETLRNRSKVKIIK